ncbi:MAG TPA: RNA polymerase factor sigma-54 [Rhizomicrobium sp.]
MALTQRLELRQGTSLVMTPQLQQAIKLLQLSNLELAGFVEQELERNPLLEREEDDSQAAEDSEHAVEVTASHETLENTLAREDFTKIEDIDAERCDVYAEEPNPFGAGATDWTKARSESTLEPNDNALEKTLARTRTLKDHLLEQLSIAALNPQHRLIAAALIDSIDEAGYLRADLGELASRMGTTLETLGDVLTVVQGFEPTGVGARTLAECLALQLREAGRFDPVMQVLVEHLDLVARRDFAALRACCNVEAEDIQDMIAEIRALTPRPGLAFGSEPVQSVVPDVFVREGPDGAWHIELNAETLPRLLVNARYYAKVAASVRDKDSRVYLLDCMNNANWLVRSLDQRARTILKVASEIVQQQDGFLTYGVRHLRPLNLRGIAEAIGMHESTVSRVTSNKYIATPRGTFELKYFFTASLQAVDGGENHSAEAVRDRIREMIQREGSLEVLSDDQIVNLLSADGVTIARRTVAKYRDAMRIPSSVERRRQKQSELSGLAGVSIHD